MPFNLHDTIYNRCISEDDTISGKPSFSFITIPFSSFLPAAFSHPKVLPQFFRNVLEPPISPDFQNVTLS